MQTARKAWQKWGEIANKMGHEIDGSDRKICRGDTLKT